ncbi:sensor histidine kinase [Novosphingobium sp. PC22D]|uniref:sensor histidine kinase n=1 Tax=Novosphingobium sp. PC22D TaxID=1962403 RepID=UPI000BEFF7B3|nr:sensor histidine kinase [Novosphingobium sp. PC22D]PEQ13399.1 sensor histidine kinase [Novosphingobium sp. PC22D]
MTQDGAIIARARTDAADRLIEAGEPLSGLQYRCGGEIGGIVAVPELLELARKVRAYGFKLARAIAAFDGSETITAWVEVSPREDEADGCDILVRSWHAMPAPQESESVLHRRKTNLDREVAELTARLDAAQRLLAVTCDSPELADVAGRMEAGIGTSWTDHLNLFDATHKQPLHWRLLDGARVEVEGSNRPWRAVLIPQVLPGFEPSGFELLLVSDVPPAAAPPEPEPEAEREGLKPGVVGLDVAPVLRQPIARIIANAETIRTQLAGPLPSPYANYAGDIVNAGKLLLELLEDLADLEVIESENFHTQPDHIDLGDVARQAAGILGVRAAEKNIGLDAPPLGESLPAIAEFRRVLQVLLNLIGNAIRYSPADSRIWIRLEADGDRARVIVADQGPGLDESEQAIVFEKFERLGRSGDGGSGLGLYISRRLAQAMGGRLTVHSARGQGARFVLEVPADVEAMAESGVSG